MKLKQVALSGAKRTSEAEVTDALFTSEVNYELLAQAVQIYRNNQRQGGAYTQTRSEVSRTKTKWYRQKGTGRARHGARSANIFVGGGVAHGPTGLENWKRNLPAKMKVAALRNALTAQLNEKMLIAGSGLTGFSGKTKEAVQAYQRLETVPNSKVLVVVAGDYANFVKSVANYVNFKATRADRVNALDVLSADLVVVASEAFEVLESRLAKVKTEVKADLSALEKKTVKAPSKTAKATTKVTSKAKTAASTTKAKVAKTAAKTKEAKA